MIIFRSADRLLGLNEGTDSMKEEEYEPLDRFGSGEGNGCIWSIQCSKQPNLWCDCGKRCRKVVNGVKKGSTWCL